jgi:hypothetical protein
VIALELDERGVSESFGGGWGRNLRSPEIRTATTRPYYRKGALVSKDVKVVSQSEEAAGRPFVRTSLQRLCSLKLVTIPAKPVLRAQAPKVPVQPSARVANEFLFHLDCARITFTACDVTRVRLIRVIADPERV